MAHLKIRKGHEVACWSDTLKKWLIEPHSSISKAKKANGLGSRCWREGEAWPPLLLA